MKRLRVKSAGQHAAHDGPLLLDTHIWIWYLEGAAHRLDADTRALLDGRAAQRDLLVSDISWWEVAVKAAKGKLVLSLDVTVWLQRAERAPGIRFLPLDRQTLLLSTRLRGELHGDPADRMLLAAAQLYSVPLVTADELMIDYAEANAGTPVIDAHVA